MGEAVHTEIKQKEKLTMFEKEIGAIREIAERWKNNRDEIRKSEAQTRISLIDPILEICGWDIRNPKEVIVEYSEGAEGNRPDYVLLGENRAAVATVEAKKPSASFPTKMAITQTQRNSEAVGAHVSIFTDGLRWTGWKNIELDESQTASYGLDFMRGEHILFEFDIEHTVNSEIYEEMRQIQEIWKPRLIATALRVRGVEPLRRKKR